MPRIDEVGTVPRKDLHIFMFWIPLAAWQTKEKSVC